MFNGAQKDCQNYYFNKIKVPIRCCTCGHCVQFPQILKAQNSCAVVV